MQEIEQNASWKAIGPNSDAVSVKRETRSPQSPTAANEASDFARVRGGSEQWDLHGIGARYFAELTAENPYSYWNGA